MRFSFRPRNKFVSFRLWKFVLVIDWLGHPYKYVTLIKVKE